METKPHVAIMVVEWDDAHTTSSEKEIKELEGGCRTISVGWLLKESEEGVWLAQDIYCEHKGCGRQIGFIPAGMVRSKKRVPLKTVRRSK